MRYDIYITRKGGLYNADVPALPGCTVLGRSEADVLQNIRDVIESHLHRLRVKKKPFPNVKVVRIHHARYPSVQSA